MRAFIFPGQGSQKIGMGAELYNNFSEAKQVFEEVNDTLGVNLSKIIFNGNEEELRLTENAQPALMCVSYAVVKVLELMLEKKISQIGSFVAGHSLGEYSALLAVNSISLSDTAKILRLRGKLMQDIVPLGIGSMAALIGVDKDIINEIRKKFLKQNEILDVGNNNSPGQIVVSGHKSAVDKVVEHYRTLNIKRVIELPVSAPFHCSLMEEVANKLKEPINELNVLEPIIPLINNVDADILLKPINIKNSLVKQITSTVRWRESIEKMISLRVDRFVELGSGNILSGLVKRINKSASTSSVGTIEDIENLVNDLEN